MTVISKPDTYHIPGQPEVDFVTDQAVEHATGRRAIFPMSELERLTLAATDAAESMHAVPDFGEPTDAQRDERKSVGYGAISAAESASVATPEVLATTPAALIGYGRNLKVFREDR